MSYKKFFLLVAGSIFSFVAVNFILWHGVTHSLFQAGDLTRLGYYATTKAAIPLSPDYEKKHVEFSDYVRENSNEQFDVLTVGDSCFNGWGGAYFQDCLSDLHGYRVINAPTVFGKGFAYADVLNILEKNGYIEKIKPKYIILGSMERSLVAEASTPSVSNWNLNRELKPLSEYIEALDSSVRGQTGLPEKNEALFPPHMIKANFELLDSVLWRKSHVNEASADVGIKQLNIKAFSNEGLENTFLYYLADRNYLNATPNYSLLNDEYNNLADHYRKMGIELVVLVITDKSEVYFPYWQDEQKVPENTFFSEFQQLPKRYIYFPTKPVLREAIASDGALDLYWADDTHWSHVAHKYVCDALVHHMPLLNKQ